jgi:hypothetical protein
MKKETKDLNNRINDAETKSELILLMTEVIMNCQTYADLLKIMLVIDKQSKKAFPDLPEEIANTLIMFIEMRMEEIDIIY